jgi:hypothetical protein
MEIEDQYLKLVADFVKIPIEMFTSKVRLREFCEARQVTCYFLKLYTKLSLWEIARIINYRSHASVLRDKKQIGWLIINDRSFAAKYKPLFNDAKALAERLEGKETNPVNIEKGDLCWFWREGQLLPILGIFKSFHIDHENNIWFRSEGSEFDFPSCKYVGAGILPEGFKRPAVIIPEEPEDISEVFYSESLIALVCETAIAHII